MSTPSRQLDLIPPEDYLAMDEASEDARLEYAAGHIFALAGASRRHAVIAGLEVSLSGLYARTDL